MAGLDVRFSQQVIWCGDPNGHGHGRLVLGTPSSSWGREEMEFITDAAYAASDFLFGHGHARWALKFDSCLYINFIHLELSSHPRSGDLTFVFKYFEGANER